MPKRVSLSGEHLPFQSIVDQQRDVEAALRLYFSSANPAFAARFQGQTAAEVEAERDSRIAEAQQLASLSLLSAIEAAFRVDYLNRCYRKRKDTLSRAFRTLHSVKGARVSLDDEILPLWRAHSVGANPLISDLVAAFNFRHWLAHGRYWLPKLGQPYDFFAIETLAATIASSLPLLD